MRWRITDDATQTVAWIEEHLGRQWLNPQLGVLVDVPSEILDRLRVAAWAGHRRLVLHILNYNVPLGKENGGQVESIENVGVRVRLPESWEPSSVRLHSPEEVGFSGPVAFSSDGSGVVGFVIPSLRIYQIAVIE